MDELMICEEKTFYNLGDLDRFMEMHFSEGHACLVSPRRNGYNVRVYEWIAEQ